MENFASFSARAFARGIYTLEAGCTIFRSPFATIDHSKSLPDDYSEQACAAAQWILHAGVQLFEMCEKHAGRTKGRLTWDLWRTKFKAISDAENLGEHCRQLASQALQAMAHIEKTGTTTNVVYEYGMSVMDGDTIVSTRPEARSYIGKREQWNEFGEDGLSDCEEHDREDE